MFVVKNGPQGPIWLKLFYSKIRAIDKVVSLIVSAVFNFKNSNIPFFVNDKLLPIFVCAYVVTAFAIVMGFVKQPVF